MAEAPSTLHIAKGELLRFDLAKQGVIQRGPPVTEGDAHGRTVRWRKLGLGR